MSGRNGQKSGKSNGLRLVQKSPDKAHRILARSHISHGRLVKIIDAYARWETVGIAAKESGVSRITVGKIYNLIRQRLLDFGMFESDETYRNRRYDMENEEEEGQRWYDENAYQARMAHALGRFRGIDPAHYHLFEAEAVFRVNYPKATQGDVKTLIMEAIKKGGPLNEVPRQDRIFEAYMERVAYPYIDKAMTAALRLFRKAEATRQAEPSDPVDPGIDVNALRRRWAVRELERAVSNDNVAPPRSD